MGRLVSTLLVVVGMTTTSVAQPVLRASGVGPRIGDKISYYRTAYFSPGTGGPAQVWDFSRLRSVRKPYSVVTEYPNTSENAFSSSNVAFKGLGVIDYVLYDSAACQAVGMTSHWIDEDVENSTSYKYEDPKLLMKYPFAYGDSFVDSFRFSSTKGEHRTIWMGTVKVEADGWGTINLMGRTLSGVLRVKTVESTTTVWFDKEGGSSDTSIDIETSYSWYIPGYREYILYITDRVWGGCCSRYYGYGYYSTMGETSELSVPDNNISLTIRQNPTHDKLRLSTTANQPLHYRIFDAKGSVVIHGDWQTSESKDCDLLIGNLVPGVYCITASSLDLQPATKRFIVE